MASLDPKTDQEAEGILCGQLTFLRRTESEVTRDFDGGGYGVLRIKERTETAAGD